MVKLGNLLFTIKTGSVMMRNMETFHLANSEKKLVLLFQGQK